MMNVYKISTHAKPPKGKFDYYTSLNCSDSDSDRLDCERFNGQPYLGKWRRAKLFFDHPNWPRADFYNFGVGVFVCNEKARDLCRPALEKDGEFLPVSIEGEPGAHFIYNVTTSGPFVDPDRSIWEYYEPKNKRMNLAAPFFRKENLKACSLFKIPEDRFCNVFCIERTANPDDNEFKAIVSHHHLTGLEFEFVWSEAKGSAIPKFSPSSKQWKLRTGSGILVK